MSGTGIWHYKVLRALPVHMLNGGRRCYNRRAIGVRFPDRGRAQLYAPMTPSPLRQSTTKLAEHKKDSCGSAKTIEDRRCNNDVGPLLVLKRGVEPCRLTGMGSGLPIRIRIQTRKVAYTLGTPKDCRPQTRKAAALCSYGSPIVKVDHEVSPTVKTKCDMVIKPVKSARANDKVSAFRKELAETCERVRALRSRLTRLEETKRRSEAVQRKALEQQDRLRSVFEALIEAEKEKLLRDNSRFGRT